MITWNCIMLHLRITTICSFFELKSINIKHMGNEDIFDNRQPSCIQLGPL